MLRLIRDPMGMSDGGRGDGASHVGAPLLQRGPTAGSKGGYSWATAIGCGRGTSSFPLSSSLNLFVAAAGAGLLSYPYAALQQGLVVNLACTAAGAALTLLSDYIIVQTAWSMRGRLTEGTLEDLALVALGPRWALWARLSVVIGVFGALIGYLIVVGDMVEPLLSRACGSSHGYAPTSACGLFTRREFTVPVLSVAVALPLSGVKAISTLAGSSLFAALTVAVVAGLVVAQGAGDVVHPGSVQPWTNDSPLDPTAPGASSAPLVLARSSLLGLMLGLPIVIFSLGNHVQVVPIFWEHLGMTAGQAAGAGAGQGQAGGAGAGQAAVQGQTLDVPGTDVDAAAGGSAVASAELSSNITQASQTKAHLSHSTAHMLARVASFPRAMWTAVGSCVVVYTATGIAGYAAFRDATHGDVLVNLPDGQPAAAAGQALLAIHVLLAYPVLLYPARLSLQDAIGSLAGSSSGSGSGSTAESGAGAASAGGQGTRPRGRCLSILSSRPVLTVLLVGTTTAAAVSFPQVSVVFGLVGAVVATFQIYALPSALLWAWAAALEGARAGATAGARVSRDESADSSIDVSAGLLSESAAATAGSGSSSLHDRGSQSARAAAWATAGREYLADLALWDGQRHRQGRPQSVERNVSKTGATAGSGPLDAGPGPLWLPTTSPRLSRLLAVLLALLFVVIGGIGTGTYVYSTWIKK